VLRESGGVDRVVLLAVGVVALVILLVALATRWSGAITGALVVLGAQQAVRLELGTHELDVWAPLLAAGLLLCAELAWWSLEPRVPAWAQPGLAVRRLATILVLCAFGAAVGAVMLVAAGASLNGGVALELAGIVAATGAVALVVYAARSSP
jgi:hypothetical protein